MVLLDCLHFAYKLGVDRVIIKRHINGYVMFDGYISEMKYITFYEFNYKNLVDYQLKDNVLVIRVH